jgi:anti-sigma B factor antagonist
MNISVRVEKNTAILDCQGKLVLGEGDMALRGQILDSLKSGAKRIVLNMEKISAMDSSGLGEIIRSYTSAKKDGVEVVLLKPNEKIFDLLTLTKLITVLPVFKTEKEALGL